MVPAPVSLARARGARPGRPFAAMMAAAGLSSLVVAGLGAGIAVLAGPPGALASVTGGVALSAVFFMAGAFGLRSIIGGPEPGVLAGALMIYALQVTGLLVVLAVTPRGFVGQPRWFAAGALAGVILWQAAQAIALRRTRAFAFGEAPAPARPDASGASRAAGEGTR